MPALATGLPSGSVPDVEQHFARGLIGEVFPRHHRSVRSPTTAWSCAGTSSKGLSFPCIQHTWRRTPRSAWMFPLPSRFPSRSTPILLRTSARRRSVSFHASRKPYAIVRPVRSRYVDRVSTPPRARLVLDIAGGGCCRSGSRTSSRCCTDCAERSRSARGYLGLGGSRPGRSRSAAGVRWPGAFNTSLLRLDVRLHRLRTGARDVADWVSSTTVSEPPRAQAPRCARNRRGHGGRSPSGVESRLRQSASARSRARRRGAPDPRNGPACRARRCEALPAAFRPARYDDDSLLRPCVRLRAINLVKRVWRERKTVSGRREPATEAWAAPYRGRARHGHRAATGRGCSRAGAPQKNPLPGTQATLRAPQAPRDLHRHAQGVPRPGNQEITSNRGGDAWAGF